MGKTYVVFIGRKPGIYNSWEVTQIQVNKFSGASHQSFETREEAVRAFNMSREKKFAAPFTATSNKCSSSASGSNSTATSSSSKKHKKSEQIATLVNAQKELA